MPKKISVSEIKKERPRYKYLSDTKSEIVYQWILGWVEEGLLTGVLEEGDIIPKKAEFAKLLDVSTSTVQNAMHRLENLGYFESRQHTGTVVKGKNQGPLQKGDTTLSKKLEGELRAFIKQNFKQGEKIPPNSEFARRFKVSARTVNDAMKTLQKEGTVLSRRGQYGSVYLGQEAKAAREEKSIFTTSPKGAPKRKNYLYIWEAVMAELKKYIVQNFEAGDRLPSMKEMAKTLNASPNTVRRGVLNLCKQGILHTQRGKYGGTYVVDVPEKDESYTWLALNPQYIENLGSN